MGRSPTATAEWGSCRSDLLTETPQSVQNYDLMLKLVMLLNYTTLSIKIGRQVRRVWVSHTFILDRDGAS